MAGELKSADPLRGLIFRSVISRSIIFQSTYSSPTKAYRSWLGDERPSHGIWVIWRRNVDVVSSSLSRQEQFFLGV